VCARTGHGARSARAQLANDACAPTQIAHIFVIRADSFFFKTHDIISPLMTPVNEETINEAENSEWVCEAVDVVHLSLGKGNRGSSCLTFAVRSRDDLTDDGDVTEQVETFCPEFVYQQFGEQ
jgi:hypothetical protein